MRTLDARQMLVKAHYERRRKHIRLLQHLERMEGEQSPSSAAEPETQPQRRGRARKTDA